MPAAAICRYIDLNLLPSGATDTGQQLLDAGDVQTIVVLRILELLDQDPQCIRTVLEHRAHDATGVDRTIREKAHRHGLHYTELAPLLRQLPEK